MGISNKTLKKILLAITFVVILIAVFNLINIEPSRNLQGEIIFKQKYNGVVVKKFLDSADHNGNKIVFKNGKTQPIHWKLSEQILIGDSISKNEGKLILDIFRKGRKVLKYDLLNNVIINK